MNIWIYSSIIIFMENSRQYGIEGSNAAVLLERIWRCDGMLSCYISLKGRPCKRRTPHIFVSIMLTFIYMLEVYPNLSMISNHFIQDHWIIFDVLGSQLLV
ncbi:hypothetical protein ACJX0J_020328 [Zea mays]